VHQTLLTLRGARLLDRSGELSPAPILYPFALEELLCRQVGDGAAPIVHLWRHPQALVMGLRDSRLPCSPQAKRALEAAGCHVAVRNSGGAAVPLDSGVVNMTLIVPKAAGVIDFRDDFERMYRLIKLTLDEPATAGRDIIKGEITGSYCPGDYDLSVRGRKFCGIAQRRQLRALAVQAFIVVEGSGNDRARRAREFYDLASCGQAGDYPHVEAEAMVSLAEALHPSLTAESFAAAVNDVLQSLGVVDAMPQGELPSDADVMEMVRQMETRYGINV